LAGDLLHTLPPIVGVALTQAAGFAVNSTSGEASWPSSPSCCGRRFKLRHLLVCPRILTATDEPTAVISDSWLTGGVQLYK